LRQSDEVPGFVREHQFLPSREWRVGFAWPDISPRLAVEIEAGVRLKYSGPTKSDYKENRKKYNYLALCGYFLLRFTPEDIEKGEALFRCGGECHDACFREKDVLWLSGESG